MVFLALVKQRFFTMSWMEGSGVSLLSVICNRELGATGHLHCSVTDKEWCVMVMVFPEFYDDINSLVNIQYQVVGVAPLHQLSHLLPVGQLFVIANEAHHCCVVRIHDVICAQQSWVIRVNSRGLRRHPWGEPVLREMTLEMLFPIRMN